MDYEKQLKKYTRAYDIIMERYAQRHIQHMGLGFAIKRIRTLIEYQFLSHYAAAPPAWRLMLRSLKRDRPLPDFAIVGPIKSGSSDLVSHLLLHPNIIPPLAKEIFSPEPETWRPFFPTLQERRKREQHVSPALSGFLAPFMHWLRLMERFHDTCPEAKIIILLRNPVERAYSHWKWDVLLGGKMLESVGYYRDFDAFVDMALALYPEMEMDTVCGFPFLQSGIYYKSVQRWQTKFGREQVLVLDAADYFCNRTSTLERIQDFLDIPRAPIAGNAPPVNINPLKRNPMSADTRQRLEAFYRPYNEKLYALLGIDYGWSKKAERVYSAA
ncbi:hypothetical protein EH223_04205 [candidate division KSB1 bacterium]|nr:sulfotransferase domain-containing protein [candidate division KSB1 bacterium]RQW05487.1 MAG: hypothetical protein EH223_04205 [candidate division KSB1 bacterium]